MLLPFNYQAVSLRLPRRFASMITSSGASYRRLSLKQVPGMHCYTMFRRGLAMSPLTVIVPRSALPWNTTQTLESFS